MKRKGELTDNLSIRWKLAAYLALFVALVLMVTWVFQVYLLNAFYERVKREELIHTAESLESQIDSKDLLSSAYNYAITGTMSVMVYRQTEDKLKEVVGVDATGKIGGIYREENIQDYYQRAVENGGSYMGQFTFGGYEVEPNRFPYFGAEDKNESGGIIRYVQAKNVRMIYARVISDGEGNPCMILLNTGLQPVDSTSKILEMQFGWIAAILLVIAAVMVVILYQKISNPLIRMTAAAKQLALGKYDAEFVAEGYKETRELAETLNYASCELSKLDRLQKELIANISHDLRTPLTMIKGYAEVMRDIPGENSPENIQIIIDETSRLSELVNDLLDLSRIQSGTRKAVMETFHLSDVIREVMKRYDAFVRHRGYKIIVNCEEDVWIHADRGMILQALYNLINNAINYTGEDLTVTVTQTVTANRVRISVTDTGEGISEDQLPLIWDRYYKVDKVHRRAMIGTGLGLSIVKEILELHGAVFGVSSKVGEGSTFWFELPTVPAPENQKKSDPEELTP